MTAARKGNEAARDPEDLARLLVARVNGGDLDGVAALYEIDAVLVTGSAGQVAVGRDAIRAYFADLVAGQTQLVPGVQRPAVRNGDVALTSSRLLDGTVTAEVARRQPDGTWRWIIDQPAIARESQP